MFYFHRAEWNIEIYPGLRVQVTPTRFRIPDITITKAALQWQRILEKPALLVIEVLSLQDTLMRIRQRVDDYLNFGTEHIWGFDPEVRRAYAEQART